MKEDPGDLFNQFFDIPTQSPEEIKRLKQDFYRRRRIEFCGSHGYVYDPIKNSGHSITYACELFRECPDCRERRVSNEMMYLLEALQRYSEDESLARLEYIVTDKKTAASITRRPNVTYRRYPIFDGETVVIVGTNISSFKRVASETALLTEEDVRQDVDVWAITPERRRITGKLFHDDGEEPEIPKEFRVTVGSPVFKRPEENTIETIQKAVKEADVEHCEDIGEVIEVMSAIIRRCLVYSGAHSGIMGWRSTTFDIRDTAWWQEKCEIIRIEDNHKDSNTDYLTKSGAPLDSGDGIPW